MDEVRFSFPKDDSPFDIFAPEAFSLLTNAPVPVPAYKPRFHEYLVVSDARCNLKFGGEGGKTYELKFLTNPGVKEELWVTCAKGTMDTPGSLEELLAKLQAALSTAEEGSQVAEGLSCCINCWKAEAPIPVATEKLVYSHHLDNLTIEQIDFFAYPRDAPSKRAEWRSISVEKVIPQEGMAKVLEAVTAKYGDQLVMGGFSNIVLAILKGAT